MRRNHPKRERTNGSQAGAKPIHIVHKIERVDHSQDPQRRDRIAEDDVGNKESNPHARGGDGQGDEQLTGKFCRGPLGGPPGQAVFKKPQRPVRRIKNDKERSTQQCGQQTGHHSQTTGQGNGDRMNFTMARIIHHTVMAAPMAPKRHYGGCGQCRPQQGQRI